MWTRCVLACLIASVVLSAGSVGAQKAPPAGAPTLAIVNGRLIDGFGGPPIERSVVLVTGNRISAIGRAGEVAIPAGVKVIDAGGRTVMPGMMDMHVHLMLVGHGNYTHWFTTYQSRWRDEIMPISARQFLMAGVTTVRDLGSPLDIIQVRERIDRGEIPGPRLFVSGPFLQPTVPPAQAAFRWAVKGVDDARAKTRKLIDAGVDWIKVVDQDRMGPGELEAIVETAHAAGKLVAVHAHKAEEIRRGIKAGADSLEHTGLGTAPEFPADIMQMAAELNSRLYWDPTVQPFFMFKDTIERPDRIDDPRLKQDLPPDIYKDVRQSLAHPSALEYWRMGLRRLPTLKRKLDQIRESGATIVVGTDAGVPLNFNFDATWRELDAMVRLGMSPMEAIQAATMWPGLMLKQPDLGTLAVGHLADIIVIDGDPLVDITSLRHVVHVVKDGKQFK
jgi:imidazolonepropionase-like amidohydrolase